MPDLGSALAAATLGVFLPAQVLGHSYADLPLLVVTAVLLVREAFASPRPLRPQALDYGVLVLLATEAVTYATSVYAPNSLLPLYRAGLGATVYFLARLGLADEWTRGPLFVVLSLLAGLCAGRAIGSVLLAHTQLVTVAGFDDLTQVRHLLRLGAWSDEPGGWIVLHLLLLPYPLILCQQATLRPFGRAVAGVLALLVILAVLLTFSRGLYLALGVFLAVGLGLQWLSGAHPWRALLKGAMAGAVVLILVVVALPCRRAVLVTARLFDNASHSRSVSGRYRAWSAALELAAERPWLGVGSGNFALRYGPHRPRDRPFLGRALSAPVELAVEQGCLGLGAGLLAATALFWTALERWRRHPPPAEAVMQGWLVASLVGVLVRGLTYSAGPAAVSSETFVYLAAALVGGARSSAA